MTIKLWKLDEFLVKMQEYWIKSFFRKYFSPLCYGDQLILWQEVAPVKTFSKLAFYVETRLPRNDSQIQHVPSILFWASFSNNSCKLLNFSFAIVTSFSAHLKKEKPARIIGQCQTIIPNISRVLLLNQIM